MSFKTLRPQIADLIKTSSKFDDVNVSLYPKLKFDGYPGAHIVPSNNEADYETTSENIRTYAFTLRVVYETQSTGMADAMTALEEVVDDLLDLFDQEDLKTGNNRTVGVNLPSGYTFINIFATPSNWGEVEGEDLLIAELSVRVRISRDIT